MNLSLPRLALILAAAAVLGYLFGQDEPTPDHRAGDPAGAETRRAPTAAPPPAAAVPWQPAPPYPGTSFRQGPPTPTDPEPLGSAAARQRTTAPGYLFRPLPRQSDTGNRYPPTAAPYAPPTYAAPQPAPQATQELRRYAPQRPGYGMPDNFRPLGDREQTRRWDGGYRRMSTDPAQFAVPGAFGRYGTLAGPT